jgi:hypothetical protein
VERLYRLVDPLEEYGITSIEEVFTFVYLCLKGSIRNFNMMDLVRAAQENQSG